MGGVVSWPPVPVEAASPDRPHYYAAAYKKKTLQGNGRARAFRQHVAAMLIEGDLKSIDVRLGNDAYHLDLETFEDVFPDLPNAVFAAIALWDNTDSQRGAEIDWFFPLGEGRLLPLTLRHDTRYALVIEVGDAYRPVCRTNKVRRVRSRRLARRLGVRGFLKADRAWTKQELCLMGRAIGLLSKRERGVLSELDLVRQRHSKQKRGKKDSMFGEHGAHFILDTETESLASIVIYDKAFHGLDTNMVGSVDDPREHAQAVLLHEVGHALTRWALLRQYDRALVAEDSFDLSRTDYKEAFESYQAVRQAYEKAFAAYKRLDAPYRKAWDRYEPTVDRYNRMIDQVKADQAVGRRSKFTQADLDAARDKVEARTEELQEAQSRREVAKKELERIQVELSSKQARVERAETRTLRRKVDLEKLSTAKPSKLLRAYKALLGPKDWPTMYGKTSLEESFAESFMLYKVDPAALRRVLPKVADWFKARKHEAYLPALRRPKRD